VRESKNCGAVLLLIIFSTRSVIAFGGRRGGLVYEDDYRGRPALSGVGRRRKCRRGATVWQRANVFIGRGMRYVPPIGWVSGAPFRVVRGTLLVEKIIYEVLDKMCRAQYHIAISNVASLL